MEQRQPFHDDSDEALAASAGRIFEEAYIRVRERGWSVVETANGFVVEIDANGATTVLLELEPPIAMEPGSIITIV